MKIKALRKGNCPFDCLRCRYPWACLYSPLILMLSCWPDFLVLPWPKTAGLCHLLLWSVGQVWLMSPGLLCSSCCGIAPLLSSPLPCRLSCHPLPWAPLPCRAAHARYSLTQRMQEKLFGKGFPNHYQYFSHIIFFINHRINSLMIIVECFSRKGKSDRR